MTTSTNNKKYFICNFKSLLLKEDFIQLKKELSSLNITDNIELILCPPTTYLYIFEDTKYKLGSQEISMYENGAYTGENSAEQLKSLNVSYTLIGHHESRCILKETETTLLNKIINAYKNNIKPIYFIGETEEEKANNQTEEVLTNQLHLLNNLPQDIIDNLIIVYEPIWSIGSGKIPQIDELNNIINFINKLINNTYNTNIPLIYGGSLNDENIESLAQIANLDGVIIGEGSTNINTLKNIYNKFKNTI